MDRQSEERLRQGFKRLNRIMIFLWKARLGRLINIWPAVFGRIMVIKHVGRISELTRHAPVNYAEVDGDIYCVAGFGAKTDWYLNIKKLPDVELWLPEGNFPARAKDISDSSERLPLIREVLIASGFAAYLFGINPKEMSNMQLYGATAHYRLIQFERDG